MDITTEFLKTILTSEKYYKGKKRTTLSKIDDGFYEKCISYIHKLENDLENSYEKEPSSQKTITLRDKCMKAKSLCKEIFECRIEKMLIFALSELKGGTPNLEFLTCYEKPMYNKILALLKDFENDIFELKAQSRPTYVVAYIKENIPEFVGYNERIYRLKCEDIVALPKTNAEVLVKAEKANII